MAYQNITLTQLLTRLSARYEGQPFWTSDQARRAINEGLRIWSLITGYWQTAFSGTTVPNDPYQVPVGIGTLLKATRVTIGGQRLFQTSLYGLDHSVRNWEGTTTQTAGAPTRPTMWAPVGLTAIAIYPADATVLGSAIVIDGVRNAPILVNGGDFLDMGDEEINTLLGYALHVLAFYKGAEALAKTRPLYVAFFKAAALKNTVFAASDLYRQTTGRDWTRLAQPMAVATSDAAAVVALTKADGSGN